MRPNKTLTALIAVCLLFTSTLGLALHHVVGCSQHGLQNHSHVHSDDSSGHFHEVDGRCLFHVVKFEPKEPKQSAPDAPHDCDEDCAVCIVLGQSLHVAMPVSVTISLASSEQQCQLRISIPSFDPIGISNPRGPPVV